MREALEDCIEDFFFLFHFQLHVDDLVALAGDAVVEAMKEGPTHDFMEYHIKSWEIHGFVRVVGHVGAEEDSGNVQKRREIHDQLEVILALGFFAIRFHCVVNI